MLITARCSIADRRERRDITLPARAWRREDGALDFGGKVDGETGRGDGLMLMISGKPRPVMPAAIFRERYILRQRMIDTERLKILSLEPHKVASRRLFKR